jgi:hypothetical protein
MALNLRVAAVTAAPGLTPSCSREPLFTAEASSATRSVTALQNRLPKWQRVGRSRLSAGMSGSRVAGHRAQRWRPRQAKTSRSAGPSSGRPWTRPRGRLPRRIASRLDIDATPGHVRLNIPMRDTALAAKLVRRQLAAGKHVRQRALGHVQILSEIRHTPERGQVRLDCAKAGHSPSIINAFVPRLSHTH